MHFFKWIALSVGIFLLTPASLHAASAGNDGMHSGMNHGTMGQAQNYNDRAFLSGMIPHHEAVVAMAKAVWRSGKDPEVKKWATSIMESQEAEIQQMRGWLKEIGGEDNNASATMRASMSMMKSSPIDLDPDRNFVAQMVGHHAGAIEMSTAALVHSENGDIIALAKRIIDAQSEEIVEFREWLQRKGNGVRL